MTQVFGPVPSRRLGRSLGIDPIPFKTCNWNCVYCQLGRTSPLTNVRRDYFPAEEIVAQVRAAIRRHGEDQIDWITFAGSGEPTLHASLGAIIGGLKSLTRIPIAVITNGSLLYLPQVRAGLLEADAVLPTLDAGSEALYQKINRPLPELRFDRFVEGLVAFRQEYGGQLWVEMMLIKGLNDSESALNDLAAVLRRVRPDELHINLPVRPPCEPWVEAADEAGLRRAESILGQVVEVVHVVRPRAGEVHLAESDDVLEAVLEIITRHPMREEELVDMLQGRSREKVVDALRQLEADGRAQVVVRQGQRFWSCAGARYVDEAFSRRHRGGAVDEA